MLPWLRYRWRLIICQLPNWLSSAFSNYSVVLLMRDHGMFASDLPRLARFFKKKKCRLLPSSPKALKGGEKKLNKTSRPRRSHMLPLVLNVPLTQCNTKGIKARANSIPSAGHSENAPRGASDMNKSLNRSCREDANDTVRFSFLFFSFLSHACKCQVMLSTVRFALHRPPKGLEERKVTFKWESKCVFISGTTCKIGI